MSSFATKIALILALGVLGGEALGITAQASPTSPYSSKGPRLTSFTEQDRIKSQLWDYIWVPIPIQPVTRIEVRISEQKVYIYQFNYLAGTSPVTTGKPGHDTPTGHFSVITKDQDHKSNLYGVLLDSNGYVIGYAQAGNPVPAGAVYDSADMPYYLRISDDGVGLHAGYLPGYPASHGCIRLPKAFAKLLFSSVPVGTPVDVIP